MESEPGTDPLIGQLLDATYRIERRLGEGGWGTVYEASHVRIERRFAIKVLRADLPREDDALARFKREARIGASLGHEHIVQVLDFNRTAGGRPYLVMELLSGEDLGQLLRREGALELVRAVSIARQVGLALADAHEQGVIHRDLKPGNVFLCGARGGGEKAKVLDFGISKITDEASTLTRRDSFLGTPSYMAPEQARGQLERIDRRTDLYSFGVILYEMLAGRAPFTGPSAPAVLYQVVHEQARPLRELRPEVPPALEGLVATAMQKEPGERQAGMRELLEQLASAMAERWPAVLAWEVEGARLPGRAPASSLPPMVDGSPSGGFSGELAPPLTFSDPAPARGKRALPAVLIGLVVGAALVAGGLLVAGRYGASAPAGASDGSTRMVASARPPDQRAAAPDRGPPSPDASLKKQVVPARQPGARPHRKKVFAPKKKRLGEGTAEPDF